VGANTWDSAIQVMPPEVEAPAGAAPAAAAIIVPAAPRAAALLAEIVVPAALQAAELQAEIEAAPQPGARSSPVMLLSLPLPRRRARVCAAHAAVLAHAAASLVARRLSPCAQGPAGTQRLQDSLLVSIAWTLYGHLRDASHNCLHSRPVTSSVSSIRLWPRAALFLPAAQLPACALRVCTQYRMHSACSWRTARARRARQAARRIGPDPGLAAFSCNFYPRSHVASLLRRVHKHAAQPRGAWR